MEMVGLKDVASLYIFVSRDLYWKHKLSINREEKCMKHSNET